MIFITYKGIKIECTSEKEAISIIKELTKEKKTKVKSNGNDNDELATTPGPFGPIIPDRPETETITPYVPIPDYPTNPYDHMPTPNYPGLDPNSPKYQKWAGDPIPVTYGIWPHTKHCETCPNNPLFKDKPEIGDTPCQWCQHGPRITCNCSNAASK